MQSYWLFLNLQAISRLALVLIHYGRVDLRGRNVAVGQHLADGVNVDAAVQEQGGVGVPEAVESHVLVDAGLFKPSFKFFLDHRVGQAFEYLSFAALPAEFERLVGDGEDSRCLCFLRDDTDAVAAIRILLDLLSGQVADVTEAEAGKTAEEGSSAEYWFVARRLGELL